MFLLGHVGLIGLRVFLRKLAIGLQRLGEFLARLPHPALVAIKNPQVVERLSHVGLMGLRVFLRKLATDLPRLGVSPEKDLSA
jgi:hypothetical protein